MKALFCFLLIIRISIDPVSAGDSNWSVIQTPATGVLNGISAPNNYFAIAVGENGTIVHFNNSDNGTLVSSGTTNELFDVFAASNRLAVASGAGIVLLWDGISWQTITKNSDSNYTGLWITPEKDYLYYQLLGNPFSFLCPYQIGAKEQGFCKGNFDAMLAMCGKGNDIKMVMQNGDIRHIKKDLSAFTGIDDLLHEEKSFLSFTGVYVPESACVPGPFKPTKIYAINNSQELYSFDGSQWNNIGVTLPNGQKLNWLNGSGNNNIIAGGFQPNDAGGNDGIIWSYDGTSWIQEIMPLGTPGLVDVAVNVGLVDLVFSNGFDVSSTTKAFGLADILGGRVAVGEEGKLTNFTYLPPLVADLSISKTLITKKPIHPGDTIVYQITIKNNGPSTASSVEFYDTYSNIIEYKNDTCDDIDLNVSLTTPDFVQRKGLFDTINKDETIVCEIEFMVNGEAGEEIINVANLISIQISDPNKKNNRVDVRQTIAR